MGSKKKRDREDPMPARGRMFGIRMPGVRVSGLRMSGGATSFGLGVLSAVAVGAMAPALGKTLRPLGKKAIKFGLRAGEEIARKMAVGRENLEDLVAEARAEYEAERAAEEAEALQEGTAEEESAPEE